MKRLLAAAALTSVVVFAPVATLAGELTAQMVAAPNPATLGDEIVVTNVVDADSTCEAPGLVFFQLFDPSMALADSTTILPDGSGNWSYAFTGDQVGTWTAIAECEADIPTAQPFFAYIDLPIVVQAPETTTTTQPTTTTTAAAPVTVTPAFTG